MTTKPTLRKGDLIALPTGNTATITGIQTITRPIPGRPGDGATLRNAATLVWYTPDDNDIFEDCILAEPNNLQPLNRIPGIDLNPTEARDALATTPPEWTERRTTIEDALTAWEATPHPAPIPTMLNREAVARLIETTDFGSMQDVARGLADDVRAGNGI